MHWNKSFALGCKPSPVPRRSHSNWFLGCQILGTGGGVEFPVEFTLQSATQAKVPQPSKIMMMANSDWIEEDSYNAGFGRSEPLGQLTASESCFRGAFLGLEIRHRIGEKAQGGKNSEISFVIGFSWEKYIMMTEISREEHAKLEWNKAKN